MASPAGRGRRNYQLRRGVWGSTSSLLSAIAGKATYRTAAPRARVSACGTRAGASPSCTGPRRRRSRLRTLPEEEFARDFSCRSIPVFWSAMSERLQPPVPNVMTASAIGTVRILIVDDEPLARDCMRLALHDVPGVTIVAEVGD